MPPEPLRILIVDDSRIFRGVLQAALAARSDVQVVGSVWSGEKAIEFVRQGPPELAPPDLITLDLNMPGRGGLDTLSDIQQFNASRRDQPPVGVVLVSALTERGAAITVEGLQRGAFDFIRKPDGPDQQANAALLQQQLFEKIDLFSQRRRRPLGSATTLTPVDQPATAARSAGRYQVIAIGASTGGPEALARMLPVLMKNTSVPVLIVQHLPSGMTGYFAESLAKKCDCRVVEAADGLTVEPRTAYIAPGGRHLVVRRHEGRVITALNDQPPENHCRPSVDVLFRSAAVAYPQSLLAVILTGMGNDGASGLGTLKRSGACVIAQDEATSVVWGMPGAAVATNHVDAVLPLAQIAPEILKLLEGGNRMELSPADFRDIRDTVHQLCGLVIADDKEYLVKSRLELVVERNGMASYTQLVERLRQPDSLLLKDQVVDAITTNETSFNRDGHLFEELRGRILPELASRLLARRRSGKIAGQLARQRARIWCAAVATGQEAYSVAMAVGDFVRARSSRDLASQQFPILASDVSGQALAVAQAGRYTAAEVDRGLTAEQRARYFRPDGGDWVVDAALRPMVEFRRLNLVRPLPELGTFDLILCRNLLIYFDQATRERLCQSLAAAIHPQGMLIIGAAESLFGVSTEFSSEMIGKTLVYRRR